MQVSRPARTALFLALLAIAFCGAVIISTALGAR